MTIEVTGTQTAFIAISGELDYNLPASIETYRTMRKDPTLALGRALSLAPIVAGEWGYEEKEDAPEDAIQFIEDVMAPLRDGFMEHALLGGIDFGWQGFEKVFTLKNERIVLSKLKPLLVDLTIILVEATTGKFTGFRQRIGGVAIDLSLAQSLLISFRVEGTDWRGQSLLENARIAYVQWMEANAVAARYDKKVSGSHWVIYFPVGTSAMNGVDTDNAEIAAAYAKALRSSSTLTIPLDFKNMVAGLEDAKLGWKIELISSSGAQQVSFVARLEYLDKQKIRALHWPERAILEGKFGTKAEAGVHQDLALAYAELQHQRITESINRECVDQLLELNFGIEARGTVVIKPAPLVNVKLGFMQEVFKELLKDPENVARIDDHALRSTVGIPESDQEKLINDPGIDDVGRVERILNVI